MNMSVFVLLTVTEIISVFK